MAKILYTQPSYQKLVSTGVVGDDTYNLTEVDDHAGRGTINNIPNVLDFDLSLGPIIINLFPISTLLVGGSNGLGFSLRGTITANAPVNNITFVGSTVPDDEDTICGDASKVVSGVGTAYHLFVAGEHNWGLTSCVATPQ